MIKINFVIDKAKFFTSSALALATTTMQRLDVIPILDKLFGSFDVALERLLILMLVDYIFGLINAMLDKTVRVTGEKAVSGFMRKIGMLVFLILLTQMSGTVDIDTNLIRQYILNALCKQGLK